MDRAGWLEERLRSRLDVEHLEIQDESARHAGHAGAAGAGGHFRVTIVCGSFRGQGLLARQRSVYAAVAEGMPSIVHALALRTLTPEEWRERAGGDGRTVERR
jgi:BolA protein